MGRGQKGSDGHDKVGLGTVRRPVIGLALGGGATGGTVAIDGGTMVGCVRVGGRVGSEPGPEGGARFSAGPPGASGIDEGGTGGGRSENIWAETGTGPSNASASKSGGRSRNALPHPQKPLAREVMGMLFTENAANSSLRSGPRAPFCSWNRPDGPMLSSGRGPVILPA